MIQFMINVQHDCRAAGCSATGLHRQRQERTDSDRTISCIEHNAVDERYIINTHALHNAAQLRRYLPRYLMVPRPLIVGRLVWHAEIAARLRISQAAKRTQSKAQVAATRQKNKEKNQTSECIPSGSCDAADDPSTSAMRKRSRMDLELYS
ncbi:hypothetical protein F5890DRAFT_1422672 [Lentinula detonsa]|uniref:Uncharacterized protein n=1 Tax=Lentinula detonsa TaxID=2804962 RepID=A0AA38PMJ2_9AGAR|nr:hypothetical protein F5890DRAFT_1422672 [Lentinula detonsa]